MGSWSEVIDYCRTSMAFEGREIFRVLFLDRKNGLIADEVQGSGTVDHTPVYPREVMRRALELSATAIVLVHNHPSGDPTPSTQDVKMTPEIIAVAKTLGLAVHDHIIIGRDGHSSLRGMKLICPASPRIGGGAGDGVAARRDQARKRPQTAAR